MENLNLPHLPIRCVSEYWSSQQEQLCSTRLLQPSHKPHRHSEYVNQPSLCKHVTTFVSETDRVMCSWEVGPPGVVGSWKAFCEVSRVVKAMGIPALLLEVGLLTQHSVSTSYLLCLNN